MNVLVVDDAPQVRSRFASLLRALPGVARVLEAGGVKEALPALEAYRPAVVILDVHMPGGSGLSFAPQVKRVCPDALLVVMSNDATDPYRRRALAAGADAFVDKSRDFDHVLARVAQLAEASRAPGSAGRREKS